MIIYNFIKYLFLYIKYNKILQRAYKNENLIQNLSKLMNTNIHQDWIGRLYMVLNPNLIKGKFDQSTLIYEFGPEGLSTNSFMEKYIMQKLLLAQQFIRTNNLFDLLTYDIKRIDEDDNYLFVIKSIVFDDFVKWLKRFVLLLGVLIILAIVAVIIYNVNLTTIN